MSHMSLLPFLFYMTGASLAWALTRYAELSVQNRGHIRLYPRSRPYPLDWPLRLLRR